MRHTESRQETVEPLIRTIVNQEESRGAWLLSADRLREFLAMDHADFYRSAYAAARSNNRMVGPESLTAEFGPENVGELISFLEALFEEQGERCNVESAFAAAGLFFPHELQAELLATYLQEGQRHAASHEIDREAFIRMLEQRRSYERARDLYLWHAVDLSRVREAAIAHFMEQHDFGFPEVARRTAERLVAFLFRRHVLESATILADISMRLHDIAVELGYAFRPGAGQEGSSEEGDEEAAAGGAPGGQYNGRDAGEGSRSRRRRGRAGTRRGEDRRSWALRVMNLSGKETDPVSLKRQYKQLMKRYHPDVNPRGLAQCQAITQAYSILIREA
jgi:hypothetical protein